MSTWKGFQRCEAINKKIPFLMLANLTNSSNASNGRASDRDLRALTLLIEPNHCIPMGLKLQAVKLN